MKKGLHAACLVLFCLSSSAGCRSAEPTAQHPSPMEDSTRRHDRIEERSLEGREVLLEGLFARPATVVLPAAGTGPVEVVLVHLHGPAYIPAVAADSAGAATAAVAVHLGAGSSVYERAFAGDGVLERLMEALQRAVREAGLDLVAAPRLYVSAFSAGYGGVRALLRRPAAAERLDGVLLLDGLHTDYVPDATPLAEGGRLNEEKMAPFVAWARRAAEGEKAFVYTHSEVFPGTYASTTETADYLLSELGLQRTPVLAWGPVGMQRLSEAGAGRFHVHGYAGNSAPDHVDHLHGLPDFFALLLR